jgi:hypothetical protein
MHGLREVDGAVIQDTYALVARFAELAVAIHDDTGHWTSRRALYAKPPLEVLAKAADMHGIDVLPELLATWEPE